MFRGEVAGIDVDLRLFETLAGFEKANVLSVVFRIISRRFTATPSSVHDQMIRGYAALLRQLIVGQLLNFVVEWLLGSSGEAVGADLGLRRALVMVICTCAVEQPRQQLLKRLLTQFGDKLFIRTSPLLYQEGRLAIQTL